MISLFSPLLIKIIPTHLFPHQVAPFVVELCQHMLGQFIVLADYDSTNENESHRGLTAAVRCPLAIG